MSRSLYFDLLEDLRDPVPRGALDGARLRLLDALVAAVVGTSTAEGANTTSALVPVRSGSARARPEGEDEIIQAVAGLARLIRCTEVDDIDLVSCTTPAAFVVPAALGGALLAGDQSADLVLEAIVKGYEVGLCLAEAIGGASVLYRGVWPSITVAAPAAAVAAAVALGRDEVGIARALSIAAQYAPPPGRFATEFERWAAFGEAVGAGVRAALAETDPNESSRRFLEVLSDDPTSAAALARPFSAASSAPRWARVERSRMKRWASAAQVAGAIDAARQIVLVSGISSDSIRRIDVYVPDAYLAMIDRAQVTERIGSLLSAQYQIAVAVLRPEDLFDSARSTLRADAEFGRLSSLVTVHPTDEFDDRYPAEWPARVELEAGGEHFSATSIQSSPSPSWTTVDVLEKARRLFDRADLPVDAALIGAGVVSFRSVVELHDALSDAGERVRTS